MRMRLIVGVVVALLIGLAVVACEENSRESGERSQEDLMLRAQRNVPVPEVQNFLTREAVAKWMETMDDPSKVFYIYLLADTGQYIGYYTSQYKPVSICTFMTPPDHKYWEVALTSPALDGVYYSGGGCEEWYFWDAATDAFISIGGGLKWFVSDQPLRVDAAPIEVQAAP